MKSVFKIAGLLLVGVLWSGVPALAKGEFTKTIKKEFDITKDGTTSIYNKYGKVDIKTWDKNRVKIDVRIVVRASSESSAQKVFDRIKIAFMNNPNYVKAETTIEPTKNEWFTWGGNKSDFSIIYEVYMPPTNKLDLGTKYCDVYVAALQGEATANVSYGNFKMDGFSDNARITLAYGNGTVSRARNVFFDAKYGNLNVQDAGDIEINSKYTTVSLEKVADVRSNTKYDTYRIGQVKDFRNNGKYDNIEIRSAQTVVVSSQYTNVKVENLAKSLDLNLEYGGAVVGTLAKGFSDVSLLGKYTDFKVGVEKGAVFHLDASTRYAGISYPSDMTVTYEYEKSSSHEVKGHVGGQNAGGTIKARLDYGGLRVKQE